MADKSLGLRRGRRGTGRERHAVAVTRRYELIVAITRPVRPSWRRLAKTTTDASRTAAERAAEQNDPARIDVAALAGRVGYRASTPDRLPVAGPVPDIDAFRVAYAALQRNARLPIDFRAVHTTDLDGWSDDPGSPAAPLPYAFLPATSAPAIVLRGGAVEMVLGSPGSSRIVPAILSVIRNVVDAGMGLPEAVAAPRVLWQDEGPERRLIAEGLPPVTETVLDQLRARGYGDIWVVREPEEGLQSFGCVNAAGRNRAGGYWEGVGDPRRRGVAAAPGRDVAPAR